MRWQVLLACLLCAAPALAQETKVATAGPEYGASPTLRRWFGDGYRDVWTTPISVPVLDLGKEAGGLEPVRQVGGLQTAGLAFRGADGKSYTFRSLHKEPERLLPPEWRSSFPAKLLRDATSATHPGAGLVLAVLADAAGIPTTHPRLVILPDDPRLGQFRAAFANQLGTIDEYPTAATAGRSGFHDAAAIISTSDLWAPLAPGTGEPDRQPRVPSCPHPRPVRGKLRSPARPMALDAGCRASTWEPLPEDPDMAFVRHNGVVIASMRRRQPRLLEFSEKFPGSLEGPTSNAAEVDRWLLSDLDGASFEQAARELQAAWSDAVIDRAVAQLPKEWQAVDNGRLAAALRARRAALVAYVRRYYRYLARDVDIELTDRDERISIHDERRRFDDDRRRCLRGEQRALLHAAIRSR